MIDFAPFIALGAIVILFIGYRLGYSEARTNLLERELNIREIAYKDGCRDAAAEFERQMKARGS
jgi:hypothetical protein